MKSSLKFIMSMSLLSGALLSCAASAVQSQSVQATKSEGLKNQGSHEKVSTDTKTYVESQKKQQVNNNTRPLSSTALMASQTDKLSLAIRSQDDTAIEQATTEVLTQNPKDTQALNALAMVYYKKQRYQASEYLLLKAMSVSANSTELYNNLALTKLALNEKREAIKLFRKALEINSTESVVGANLGALYLEEKDFAKAELALEIPFKKGTKDIKILSNYAVALTGVGKADKAGALLDTLLKENPSQRDIMLNYSINLIEHQKKFKEGLDLLNRLKFVGAPVEARNLIKELESKAKSGLK